MSNVISQVLAPVQKLIAKTSLASLWAKEPARVVSVVAAVIVFVCAKLGVVVPVESVAHAVAFAVPLLVGGEVIRSQVSPAKPGAVLIGTPKA